MKTIVLEAFGGIEQLKVEEHAVPTPNEGELLVQIKAISINPVDVKTRAGKGLAGRYKEFLPLVLGWDISGVVTQVGPKTENYKAGDEVFGMAHFPALGKAYAEYATVPAFHVALKPSNITHEEAAGATLAALTAWQAFKNHTQIKKGDRVLIHAASGGVGHFAVQIAKHLGAYVIGTSSAANREFVLSLGADEHVDYHKQPFEEVVKDIDIVLDAIGGENLERSFHVAKSNAVLISIPSGVSAEIIEKAKSKGINALFFLVAANGEDMQQIAKLLANGTLRSHISHRFPFAEMGQAHLQVETGRTQGKVVVTL